MTIPKFWRWLMGLLLATGMVMVPAIHYRQVYRTSKRLRVVAEDKLYRSGCMTADGLREAIKAHHIKTVINLQDEAPDPSINEHYFTLRTVPESEVCRSLGVKYIFLPVELVYSRQFPGKHPATVDSFLRIMDNKDNWPVLIHCKAGLHRTGVLAAMYRREYEGWSAQQALHELKNHGFGEFVSSAANPYIVQYVLQYQPRRQGTENPFVDASFIQGVSHRPLPTDPVVTPVPAGTRLP